MANTNNNRRRKSAAAKKRKRQRLLIRIITIVIAVAMVATIVLGAISCNRKDNIGKTENNTTVSEDDETRSDVDSGRISLVAVGDIIAHETILNLAETDSGYDFTSLFSELKSDISSVDLAIANVETPLGGGPFTGYPSFNTPDEMGLAVIDTGFDVALQASNHSMDSGTNGIRHCIDFWNGHSSEITMVGMNDSEERRNSIPIVNVKGMKIAVLNYTYGLNGYELPDDEQYLVTVMNDGTRDFISNQIRRANEEADFVIVCPHWGEENLFNDVTDFQNDWAHLFTEAGADLILGTHPHVIEKIEWITSDNGNRALCYYSLGNFVSNQQYTDLVLGGMAYLDLIVENGQVRIDESSCSCIPVVTHNDKTRDPVVIKTYYLADYTDELADVHDTKLSFDEDFSLSLLNDKANTVFGQYRKDKIR